MPNFFVGGVVPADSPLYIKRQADRELQTFLLAMNYVRVIEPRHQGKTSLLHSVPILMGAQYVTVYVNARHLNNTDETNWYKSFYKQLVSPNVGFLPEDQIVTFPANKDGWHDLIVCLAKKSQENGRRLIVIFDDLHEIRMNWHDGFFAVLRGIYDSRSSARDYLNNLTFVFAGTFNHLALMDQETLSPFVVAQDVYLTDFTLDQTYQLATYLGLGEKQTEVVAHHIHLWTDGQPYLTHKLCSHLAKGQDFSITAIDKLATKSATDHNLIVPMFAKLRKFPQFNERAKEIAADTETLFQPDESDQMPLHLLGLIKGDEQGFCQIRNRLYRQFLLGHDSKSKKNKSKGNDMTNYFDSGYALVIGIANYSHIRKLPLTVVKDAQDIHDLLCSPAYGGYRPENVRLLTDEQATRDNIREGFKWLAEKAKGEATAVSFFSGHGGQVTSGEHAGNYLLPYECRANDIPGTSISGATLTGWLRQIEAHRLLVCFDSCFSGGAGETKEIGDGQLDFKSGLSANYYEQLAKGKGRVIMASSRADETSLVLGGMTNSLFTHYLLEGLRGQAGSPELGYVGVFDLFDHVSRNVPKRAEQHPIFKAEVEDNFPVALYLGGEKRALPAVPQPVTFVESTTVNERQLRQSMVKLFTEGDLELLCTDITDHLQEAGFDEMVTLDIVGGNNLELKCHNLIGYLKRRGKLAYLITAVREARPGSI